MKWLFAIIILVAALLFLGDLVATNIVERQASDEVSAELDAPAEVELRGWPVTLRLLQRRVPEVVVSATDVPLRQTPGQLRTLDVTLQDVAVPWTLTGGFSVDGAVTADRGRFVAELDEEGIAELVNLPVQITLEEGIVRASLGGAQLDASATVEEGRIVLRPSAVGLIDLGEISIPLQGLPEGAVVEELTIVPGVMVLEGSITELRLQTDQ